MGRPKGHRLSQDSRDRIGEGVRRAAAERRPWLEVSHGILNAANAGDHAQASALLWDYIDEHAADYAPDQAAILNMSQDDRRVAIAEMAQMTDDLHAETVRLQAERRNAVSDQEIEDFRKMLLRDAKAMIALSAELRGYREPSPYADIPSPTVRAAARRRIDGSFQGDAIAELPYNASRNE